MTRLKEIMAETGATGLGRRLVYNGIFELSDRLDATAKRLRYREANHRLTRAQRDLLQRNTALKDRHHGERCFVLGNGPSLNKCDLSLLKGEITFAVNAFWKHPMAMALKPTYYAFTDDALCSEEPAALEFIEQMRAHVAPQHFITSVSFAQAVRRRELLPLDQTYYVGIDCTLWDDVVDHIDLTRVLPAPNTVLQTSIAAALYMGIKEIYFIGADHDWLAYVKPDTHFYEGETFKGQQEYGEKVVGRRTYLERIEYTHNLWKGAASLKKLSQAHGATIFNATEGGFMDVFPCVRYAPLFEDGE